MKTHLKYLFIAAITITALGCGKDPNNNCDTTAANHTALILIADSNPAATTYKTNVISFNFTQVIPTQSGCLPGKTSVKLTNVTNQSISFNYTVNVTVSGTPSWTYTSSATLAANATMDAGVINTGNVGFDTNGFALSVTVNTK